VIKQDRQSGLQKRNHERKPPFSGMKICVVTILQLKM